LTALSSCTVPNKKETLAEKAHRIHRKVFTLDSHVDTPMRTFRTPSDLSVRHEAAQPGGGELDFPRMKEGGLDAAFFAVYVRQGTLSDTARVNAARLAENMIDMVHAWENQYPAWIRFGLTPEAAAAVSSDTRRIVFLGVENGYAVGTELRRVSHLFERGVRYITLCHMSNNDLCDSSTDPDGPDWYGLSPFGETVVREMNRIGMLVDVSHASDAAFWDVMKISRAPVIASHSCCRALCEHARNLSDSMLVALAKNRGVVQVNLCSFYLVQKPQNPARDAAKDSLKKVYGESSAIADPGMRAAYEKARDHIDLKYPEPRATVKDLVDHIDHAVAVAGIDHVGIGSDFDGGAGLSDCTDVSQMETITVELVRRGYSERDIAKVWSGNFLRAWRGALRAAEREQ
jgi:membrane dipeptidase